MRGRQGEEVRATSNGLSFCVAGPLLGFPVRSVRVDIVSLWLGTGTSLAMLSTCIAQATSKVGTCSPTNAGTTDLALPLTVGPS